MERRLTLSKQLLLLSGIPFCALLISVVLLATQTITAWRNVRQTVALGRVISAAEEYSRAVPAEAIPSLGAQQTRSVEQKTLIPAARARTDAAIASLRLEAEAANLTDGIALKYLAGALTIDLRSNRDRVDAGTQNLPAILATMRPETVDAIELIGRLAVLSTDAEVSRLILAYNVALSLNDAMLVERNVRPIAGVDGRLDPGLVNGEAVGIAEQDLLTKQFERLAADDVLPIWHRFLQDAAAAEVSRLRRTVLGLGGTLDPRGVDRWSDAIDKRLKLMTDVVSASSQTLQRTVEARSRSALTTLFIYAGLLVSALLLVVIIVEITRRQLAGRIRHLCTAMRRLANGDLAFAVPKAEACDELGEMADTLAFFKVSLIERDRLEKTQIAASAALLDEKDRLRVTLHSIGDGVIVTGPDGCVTMMNAAAVTLRGGELSDHLGRPLDSFLKLASPSGFGSRCIGDVYVNAETLSAHAASGDATLLKSDGTEIIINVSDAVISGHNSDYIGSVTVLHDVSEARSLLKHISHLAHFDTLTGLPNRTLFWQRLDDAVTKARDKQERCALLYLDLDGFKHVNDTLGHALGDVLLVEVGRRLAWTVRKSDTVARLGGDEFVVLIGGLCEVSEAKKIAEAILQSVSDIDSVENNQIDISFSIGIAFYPNDAEDAEQLLMHADTAMYQAKNNGRNSYAFYDAMVGLANLRRNEMRLQLVKSMQFEQFHLLFQPKIDMISDNVVGAEALIRWAPEPNRVISPIDFIPITEETGLIRPLSEWVVKEACCQVRAWMDRGLPLTPVSVNISLKSLQDPGFLNVVKGSLVAAGLPGTSLEIEITESIAMSDSARIVSVLDEIRRLGVRVAIDDFGTGFSSLSQLRRLPIDIIKIDRSFVNRMIEDPEDAALVRTIIAMAADIGKHIIVEGVETEQQRQMLIRAGCREGQGYLFSKPIHPNIFAQEFLNPGAYRDSA